MDKNLFNSLGLNNSEAEIYSALLAKGALTARQLSVATDLSRTNCYNILASLENYGLIEQQKRGAKTYFHPLHPNKLEELIESREKQLKQAKLTLAASLPAIMSQFNLAIGRPGIKFFEGKDGVQKVLEDSLTAKEEIVTYADIESIVKYINEINEAYVKKRAKSGIKKRAILVDSPFARNYLKNYYKDVTDIKLIGHEAAPFKTVMQIYDGKISYITLTEKNMIGVIIEDSNIYKMHKYIFEYLWRVAPITKL
jgi:sugar-specific transcriptional regulator TrmB